MSEKQKKSKRFFHFAICSSLRPPASGLRCGVTILEVLMAIFVLFIGVTGVLALFPIGARLSQQSSDDVMASLTVEKALAAVRLQTGMRERVMAWSASNTDGDVLAWDGSESKGVDGTTGNIVNVNASPLGPTKIEPTIVYSGGAIQTLPSDAVIWYDATAPDGYVPDAGGTKVTTIIDRTGNGFNATHSDSTRWPTITASTTGLNDLQTFAFDGGSDGLDISGTPSSRFPTAATAFIVVKLDPSNASYVLLSNVHPTYCGQWRNSSGNFAARFLRNTAVFSPYFPMDVTGSVIYEITSTSATWEIRKNGGSVSGVISSTYEATYPSTPTPHPTWYLGYRGTVGTGFMFKGNFAEFIIYPRALASTEKEMIGGFLAAKYNIFSPGYPTYSDSSWLITPKQAAGETTRHDRAIMLMLDGNAAGKPFRLDNATTFSPLVFASTQNQCTQFNDGLIVATDQYTLAGARSLDHEWATIPKRFYENGSSNAQWVLGEGAAAGYGYLVILNRVAGSDAAVKAYVLVYKGYDSSLPPEGNEPPIRYFTTTIPMSALR